MNAALSQYRDNAILSASPEKLVTMLYDRLLLDIDRAANAQEGQDWTEANAQLQHAQQIVVQLNTSLTDTWSGSAELRAVYSYLTSQLVSANVNRDVEVTRECRELVAPLRDAWHEAAAAVAS